MCSQYWPKIGQMMKFGKYVVDLISETEYDGFTVRTISILQDKVCDSTSEHPQFVCNNPHNTTLFIYIACMHNEHI